MRILTGLRCSAQNLHVGNYLWAVKPLTEIAKNGETFLFLADAHSLSTVHNGEQMARNKREVLLDYCALIDDSLLYSDNFYIFEQSKVRRLMDIFWALCSVTPYSLILRSHAFKDSQAKNSDINMAVFNYSILMAADIITYDVDFVPVGKDQQQHIEFTRDIAEYFNKEFQTEIFKLPEGKISEEVGLIPGLDGRKMSKSYDNYIGVFEDEKILKKKIMAIPTDDTPLEAPKNPDTCNVFNLIKFFASPERREEIRGKYLAGWYGYGHAKLELLEIILSYTKPFREKREKLKNDFSVIEKILEKGNKRANQLADRKFKKLREIVGLVWFEKIDYFKTLEEELYSLFKETNKVFSLSDFLESTQNFNWRAIYYSLENKWLKIPKETLFKKDIKYVVTKHSHKFKELENYKGIYFLYDFKDKVYSARDKYPFYGKWKQEILIYLKSQLNWL